MATESANETKREGRDNLPEKEKNKERHRLGIGFRLLHHSLYQRNCNNISSSPIPDTSHLAKMGSFVTSTAPPGVSLIDLMSSSNIVFAHLCFCFPSNLAYICIVWYSWHSKNNKTERQTETKSLIQTNSKTHTRVIYKETDTVKHRLK